MVDLKVKSINEGEYLLVDEKRNRLYYLYIEFYGIDNPKLDDIITLDERLLNKNWDGYTQPYAFEVVKSKCDYDESKKEEYLVIETNGKNILLRRIYG